MLAFDLDVVGVHVLQKLEQLVVRYSAVVEVNHALLFLREVILEECLEEGRPRRQYDLVRENLLAFDQEGHIAELLLVDHVQEVLLDGCQTGYLD